MRGAVKHLYVGTKRAIYTQADWLELPESVQIGLANVGLRDFSDVVIASTDSGAFSTRDFVFDWKDHVLDEKGYQAMIQVEKLAIQKIARIEEESETRMVVSGDKPIFTITGFFGFLAPPMKVLPNDDDPQES